VAAILRLEKSQDELLAVLPYIRRAGKLGAPPTAEALDVVFVELDPVVPAARGALFAVEKHDASRATMDRVSNDAVFREVDAISRNRRDGQPP
jgi:hypothetical protein